MSDSPATDQRNYKLLFVDLDDTLVNTDMFLESILVFLKQNPLNVFRLLFWLLKSRANAKTLVAQQTHVDVESLPYNQEVLDLIAHKRRQGCEVILATASHEVFADAVAAHLGCFDAVIATTAKDNLKGSAKLRRIREYSGEHEFAYAGDSKADRPIWEAATANIMVNASKTDVARADAAGKLERNIQTRKSVIGSFLRTMRVHQYVKNGLIAVPLFTSHNYSEPMAIAAIALAIVCFSLCASGVYFLNDLLDLEADRQHTSKKNRPLAAGQLPIPVGLAGAALLPTAAFLVAVNYLSTPFVVVLTIYFAITCAYSFVLKSIATIDVMTLAVLYTLRVIAGIAVLGTEYSSWLLAFSVFIFASLAFLKRFIEVAASGDATSQIKGRGYGYEDKESLFVLGSGNGLLSVLVLSLYISSPAVSVYYSTPELLWLLCLLVLYWCNRLWVEARRGTIHEDPIVFALRDSVSRWTVVCAVAVVLAARFV